MNKNLISNFYQSCNMSDHCHFNSLVLALKIFYRTGLSIFSNHITCKKFLKHYRIDLETFLKLPQQDISDLITNYLVHGKLSRQYKIVIFSAIKHAGSIRC